MFLLILLDLLSGQKAIAATQFNVQGQIYKTTCTVQTPGDGTSIVLEDVTTKALQDARSYPVSPKEFTINITCSPAFWREVTGAFTTDGVVEGASDAVHLKNTITDTTGAKNVGLQIKDKITDTAVDFSTTQKFTLDLSSESSDSDNSASVNSASFKFEVGYIPYNGTPQKGDVHAAATFTLTYS